MRFKKICKYFAVHLFSFSGPIGLPFVGHIPFIDAKNVGRSCRKLGKKYGDIFSIFLGTKPVVILNSWPVIKEAFGRKEFNGRPNMFSGTFYQKGKTGKLQNFYQSKYYAYSTYSDGLRVPGFGFSVHYLVFITNFRNCRFFQT